MVQFIQIFIINGTSLKQQPLALPAVALLVVTLKDFFFDFQKTFSLLYIIRNECIQVYKRVNCNKSKVSRATFLQFNDFHLKPSKTTLSKNTLAKLSRVRLVGRPNEMSSKLKTEYFKIPHGIRASYQLNDNQLNILYK